MSQALIDRVSEAEPAGDLSGLYCTGQQIRIGDPKRPLRRQPDGSAAGHREVEEELPGSEWLTTEDIHQRRVPQEADSRRKDQNLRVLLLGV